MDHTFEIFGDAQGCSLEDVLKRIPAGVEPQDVWLEYAGCGSHRVEVRWTDDKPEPEMLDAADWDDAGAAAREQLQQEAREWEDETGHLWP